MYKNWKLRLGYTAILAVFASWLFYSIPLIKMLFWLNAGAASAEFQNSKLFLPIALVELSLIWAVFYALFYRFSSWRSKRRGQKA